MIIAFSKYEGAGNDFILIDNRSGTISLSKKQVAHLCDRHFGIGADGLMLLENETGCDFRMVYFNSDGAESSMCGNGGRCITAFAKKLGVISEAAVFMAIDGTHSAEIEGSQVRLGMIDVEAIEVSKNAAILDTGSPHFVSFIEEPVSDINLIERAHSVRYNRRFREEGINVNYANTSDGSIDMRTYERGVENETLACGTGATATALAAYRMNLINTTTIPVRVAGGELEISFKADESGFSNVKLKGPATFVFSGEISL